jgi:DNA gyrase/topoisomerase IV, subunit A
MQACQLARTFHPAVDDRCVAPAGVRGWWGRCWASTTRTATPLYTMRLCAWRRTFPCRPPWYAPDSSFTRAYLCCWRLLACSRIPVMSIVTLNLQISGHGNFGSIDNDPAAAMRYTECRLQALTSAMLLADLDPQITPFTPNFDESQVRVIGACPHGRPACALQSLRISCTAAES